MPHASMRAGPVSILVFVDVPLRRRVPGLLLCRRNRVSILVFVDVPLRRSLRGRQHPPGRRVSILVFVDVPLRRLFEEKDYYRCELKFQSLFSWMFL